ncbi:MAG: hypothetical protein QOG64_1658, partial [Acidimicrobiaceae bacterium]|nr:hypothetical protein [Acidimicrobiaceae bacterium]
LTAAHHHRLDAERVRAVRDALLEAREAVMQALNNDRP